MTTFNVSISESGAALERPTATWLVKQAIIEQGVAVDHVGQKSVIAENGSAASTISCSLKTTCALAEAGAAQDRFSQTQGAIGAWSVAIVEVLDANR